LCDRALWLDRGEVVMYGEIRPVLDAYQGQFAIASKTAAAPE
jgi:ABC-type polysaccharide/polyol phosphate transport system ATPase subunit